MRGSSHHSGQSVQHAARNSKKFHQPLQEWNLKKGGAGFENKVKKMGAAQIQEKLRIIYPGGYDILRLHYTKSVATSCMKAIRDSRDCDAAGTSVTAFKQTSHVMNSVYGECIEGLVRGDHKVQSSEVEQKLIAQLRTNKDEKSVDFPKRAENQS